MGAAAPPCNRGARQEEHAATHASRLEWSALTSLGAPDRGFSGAAFPPSRQRRGGGPTAPRPTCIASLNALNAAPSHAAAAAAVAAAAATTQRLRRSGISSAARPLAAHRLGSRGGLPRGGAQHIYTIALQLLSQADALSACALTLLPLSTAAQARASRQLQQAEAAAPAAAPAPEEAGWATPSPLPAPAPSEDWSIAEQPPPQPEQPPPEQQPGEQQPGGGLPWALLFSDEFDGSSLDTSKWNYLIGQGYEYGLPGFSNGEVVSAALLFGW